MKRNRTRTYRRPTPRYDSIQSRAEFQAQVFAFVVFAILAATVVTCIVHDVHTMRAVDAIVERTSAMAGW